MPGFCPNGTTLTIGGTSIGSVKSATIGKAGAEIDVTSLGSAAKTYEAGLLDLTLTVEVLGIPATTQGTKGTVVITFPVATGISAFTTTNAVCTNAQTGGITVDGVIVTTLTFRQGHA